MYKKLLLLVIVSNIILLFCSCSAPTSKTYESEPSIIIPSPFNTSNANVTPLPSSAPTPSLSEESCIYFGFASYDLSQPNVIIFDSYTVGDNNIIIPTDSSVAYQIINNCPVFLGEVSSPSLLTSPSEITNYKNSIYGFLCHITVSCASNKIISMHEANSANYFMMQPGGTIIQKGG